MAKLHIVNGLQIFKIVNAGYLNRVLVLAQVYHIPAQNQLGTLNKVA